MTNKISILTLMLLVIICSAQVQKETATYRISYSYTFPPDTTPDVYRVLMEEYTGHLCGNSPGAENVLYNTIKPLYTDTLVIVSVHAGYFSEPCPPQPLPSGAPIGSYADDFRTPAGDNWDTLFLIFGSNPVGMVNRVGYPSTHVSAYSIWNSKIASIIHNVPKIKIRIHTEYNPMTRQLDTYTETKFLTQLSGNYMLNVVLTEDSIVTWQQDYSVSDFNDSDYVDRYVLRGSLNGALGEQVDTASTTAAGTIFLKDYSTTLASTWNENRIHVVAFLYEDNTKEILNVTEDDHFTLVTGIRETALENYFTISPNPLTSTSILQINAELKDAEIIIYDMLGKEMIRKKLTSNRVEIGKGNLESGVYIVRMKNNERQLVQKIIIE